MSVKMRIQTIRVMVLYLLSILGKSTSAFDETAPSLGAHNQNMDEINSIEADQVPNKRSYSYVSEYKRLPVYNFGLGKRSFGMQNTGAKRIRPYSFGLGKRARSYNFGIGKKSDRIMSMDWPEEIYDEVYPHEDLDILHDKRTNRLYNFGVGKRLDDEVDSDSSQDEKRGKSYDFGLGKRSVEGLKSDQSGDVLGNKRVRSYDFGLGKRATSVGKRPTDKNYNFGLGKRSNEAFEEEENLSML